MSIPYRSCFVPYCKNTTVTTPSKKFVTVPGAEVRRKLWFEAVRREYKQTKTRYFCCQDHFDLETDMENYLMHSMMGAKIILKPLAVPHVFNWPESSSNKNLKQDEFILTEDSQEYDFGTQNSLGMINKCQQTSPLEVRSVAVNCNLDLDTTDLTITKDTTTSPMKRTFFKVEDIRSAEATTVTVSSNSDFVSPKVCDTASGSNKLVNKGKTKNGVKISEDELILRRKRQTAQRVRAYRERKKALGFQSSSQAKLNSEPTEKIIRLITDAMSNASSSRPEFNTSIVQSGEHVSENIVTEKILHQKQLNAERCRRYRQKCKRLKSGASSNQGTSDSDTSTSQDTSFPANKERQKTWNIVCNINENDTLKIKDPRICQLHVSEGSLDSEKSSSKVYLKKDAIPNKNLLPSKNMRVSDESNLEILPYKDSSEDQDAHLATELKQEPDDFFIEEQKFETEDHFFPNVIIEETWKNENDYNQISTEIKNELVSIKQENDIQENQNIIKEEKIDQKINIKQELLEEDTLNDQSNAIGRMDIVSSIKQEINIDSSTDLILKESIDSIKKECNISGNSYLNDIENRLDYVRDKWIRNINLSGSSLKVMNKKYFNPSTGIYICAVCGNLYTKQLEFSYHTMTKHHLKQKKLYKTESDQKDTGTTILNKDENELKEEMEDNSDEIVNATTGENEFNCEVCLKSFSQKDILNQHLLLLHQGRKRYKCDFCTNSFAYKCNLNKHLLRHAGKPFKCDICIKSFFQKSHLDNHLRFHTGQKPFNCNVCFKSFAHTENLNKHKRSHRGKKVFNCEICMKSFLLKCNLNMHMRLHTGETPFKCDVCPKSFPRKDSLNTHVLCHTGGKPFQCDICFKNFTRKNAVIRHLRCHTGEKPFKCEVCLKSYSEKRSLIKHIRCHTGEKPFNCDICLKSFPQKGNLKKHLRSHTGETPFKCDICLKYFTRRNTLNRHLYSHTEKRTI